MTKKLENQESESRSKYVMKLKRRSRSAKHLTSSMTKKLLFDEKDQFEDGVWIFEH